MQYKIIVDKQPSSNPSDEKKEYIIDIEELRVKGEAYDSLNIEMDRTYVTRRLSLSEYGVLSVLEEPIIQELTDVDIKLFEGDNYIYLIDMQGNKFYAEYLIKNDFNDIYATKNEMNSAITQTAQSIELSVNQKLEGYSTTQEMNSAIYQTAQSITSSVNQTLKNYATSDDLEDEVTELNSTITQTAQEINLEVSKKIDDEELTGANITLRINEDTSEATIDADKISLEGKEINLTSDDISIASDNFSVDKNGNMNCSNVNIMGGKIKLDAGDASNPNFQIGNYLMMTDTYFCIGEKGFNSNSIEILASPWDASRIGMIDSSNNYTEILASGITTPKLTQTSLESIKKNISKFVKNATDIINSSDIYEYNLKSDKDTDKKLIGFVIGDNYKTPDEVISKEGQGIELYSAIGILWKGFQEREEIIKQLKEENKRKDKTLAELILRVEQLEKEVQHE